MKKSLADKEIDKIWKRVNGRDPNESMYWAVLKIIKDYWERRDKDSDYARYI